MFINTETFTQAAKEHMTAVSKLSYDFAREVVSAHASAVAAYRDAFNTDALIAEGKKWTDLYTGAVQKAVQTATTK